MTKIKGYVKFKNYIPLMQNAVIGKSGLVIEAFPNANFKVKLDDGKEVLCHLSGKMRINRIRILPGDKVTVEITPYDERRGRIIYRGK